MSEEKSAFSSRRALFGVAAGLTGMGPPTAGAGRTDHRQREAYAIRRDAALYYRDLPRQTQITNSDEALYPTGWANFAKGLPHTGRGEPESGAYDALRSACLSGDPVAFEKIPLGGAARLVDPLGAWMFAFTGFDSHQSVIPAPPAFASAAMAADMAEVYWRALCRDVGFREYAASPLIQSAVDDLARLSAYSGPRRNGQITPDTVFRGASQGDQAGSLISQFLFQPIPYGGTVIPQLWRTAVGGLDHLTNWDDWLAIQSGKAPVSQMRPDTSPRYIRNLRDLAIFVQRDFTFEAFLNAALILLGLGPAFIRSNNPYKLSTTSGAFVSFGGPMILDTVSRAALASLCACWYQKWPMHRRIRPEAFAGRVHQTASQSVNYPIHTELMRSSALDRIKSAYGTYLLPMAYPEGCPLHPSYPAGHATIAGACVTILKAFFEESLEVPNPVLPSMDGLQLEPYRGESLTVGGELNKLASNIALGRDAAGVHYRSDGIEGIRLGEQVAIGLLRDLQMAVPEEFGRFRFTTYDGALYEV